MDNIKGSKNALTKTQVQHMQSNALFRLLDKGLASKSVFNRKQLGSTLQLWP